MFEFYTGVWWYLDYQAHSGYHLQCSVKSQNWGFLRKMIFCVLGGPKKPYQIFFWAPQNTKKWFFQKTWVLWFDKTLPLHWGWFPQSHGKLGTIRHQTHWQLKICNFFSFSVTGNVSMAQELWSIVSKTHFAFCEDFAWMLVVFSG